MEIAISHGSAIDEMVIGDQIVNALFEDMSNGELVSSMVEKQRSRILQLLIDVGGMDMDQAVSMVKAHITVRT